MPQALMPPFLLAATILVLAGGAKLRAPAGAASAIAVLGGLRPGLGRPLARALGAFEVTLGTLAAVAPHRLVAIAVAGLYLIFALSAAALARRRAACGCFGAVGSPASATQTLLSSGLATASGAAAMSPPHGLAWLLGRPAGPGLALIVGIAGAAYATVLAYTELPRAWNAWRAWEARGPR